MLSLALIHTLFSHVSHLTAPFLKLMVVLVYQPLKKGCWSEKRKDNQTCITQGLHFFLPTVEVMQNQFKIYTPGTSTLVLKGPELSSCWTLYTSMYAFLEQ